MVALLILNTQPVLGFSLFSVGDDRDKHFLLYPEDNLFSPLDIMDTLQTCQFRQHTYYSIL